MLSSRAAAFGELIAAQAPEREVVLLPEPADFAAAVRHARVIFAPYPPREGWAPARRLELLQLCGVGVDHFFPTVDLPAHVEIAGMRGAFSEDAAEHAMTMLLALARGLGSFLEDQRARTWNQRMVPRLRGRRLAIIGLGGIGTAIAKRAAVFGLEVRGLCRTPRPMEHLDAVYGRQGLHSLAAWCDALVIAAPRTPETEGMIDNVVIGCLKKGAIVVHLARGGIVDERALLARLDAGTLSAALDVFVDEPLDAQSPLWGRPNVIITPHVAGFGEGYLETAVQMLLENVARLERGEPRFGLVDRTLGY